jgi:hypothetical protein
MDAPGHRYGAALANTIEDKWRARWEEAGTYLAPNPTKPQPLIGLQEGGCAAGCGATPPRAQKGHLADVRPASAPYVAACRPGTTQSNKRKDVARW